MKKGTKAPYKKALITMEEMGKILLLDDKHYRTIYSYINDKIIEPAKESPYDGMLFDRAQIFKILGFEHEPNEPFIDSIEASKIFRVDPKTMGAHVKRWKLPHYRIKNVKGAKIYYLRSELESATSYKAKWDNGFADYIARHYFLRETLKYVFNSQILSGLKQEESELLNTILFEKADIEKIAKEKDLTPARVRQKFIIACKRAYFSVKILESKLNNMKLIEQQNRISDDKNRILFNRLQEVDQASLSGLNMNDSSLLHIHELGLSHRAERILKEMDIRTLFELADMPRMRILYRRDVGKKTMMELESALKAHNLWWKDNPTAIDINSSKEVKPRNNRKNDGEPLKDDVLLAIPYDKENNTNGVSKEENTIDKIRKCMLFSQLIGLKKKFTHAELKDPIIMQECEAQERKIKHEIYNEKK